MNIRSLRPEDCKIVAGLHNKYIPQGTLKLLGDYFTELIYQTLVDSKNGFCLITEDRGRVAGVISGTTDIKKFYSEFLRKYPFRAPAIVMLKSFNLSVLKKIICLTKYPKQFPDLPNAEILSFFVREEYRKTGLTFTLLQNVIEAFQKRGVHQVRLTMHSSLTDNQRLYEMFGAKLHANIKFSENDQLKIFIWDIDNFSIGAH